MDKEKNVMTQDEQGDSSRLKSRGLGYQRVYRAVLYSLQGFSSSLKYEAAFRQELILACVLIPVALWLPVPPVAKVCLIGSMLLVLIVELVNSALEAVVDYISLSLHPLAKRAKDMASAAVFLTMVHLVFVWGYLIYSYREAIFNGS